MKSILKSILVVALSIAAITTNGQTLKKTYYPYKNQIKEEFYVNTNGEKNGLYKAFNESGIIEMEANYKNGVMDGMVKEYYPSLTKACLKRTAIYKNGDVNGLTTLYEFDCNVISSQGNCSSYYIRQGKWDVLEKLEAEMPEGFKFLKYSQVYKDGKVIELPTVEYYYPSNKLAMETKGNKKIHYTPNGKIMLEETYDGINLIEEKYIFESGKVAQLNKYYKQNNDSIAELNWWYESGKVRLVKKDINGESVIYENYNEDGSKTQNMINHENEKQMEKQNLEKRLQRKKEIVVKINRFIFEADTTSNNNPEQGLSDYKGILKAVNAQLGELNSSDTINKAFYNTKIKELNEKILVVEKRVSNRSRLNDEILSQDDLIKEKSDKFQQKYGAQNNNYPFGEFVYNAADKHLVTMYNNFTNLFSFKSDKNLEEAKVIGAKIIAAFDKMLLLDNESAKELNKKLKKTKTVEEETQLLGF